MAAASAAAAATLLGDEAAAQAAIAATQAATDQGQQSEWFPIVCEYIGELYLVKEGDDEGVQQHLQADQLRAIMAAVHHAVAAANPPLPYPPPTTLGLLPNSVVKVVKQQLSYMKLRDGGYDALGSDQDASE